MMQALEGQLKPERTSFFLKEAVKFVPIEEFLTLRFRQRRFFDFLEYKQLSDAADVIQKVAVENGTTYELTQEMDSSRDPRVNIARQITRNMSLAEYLFARHTVLDETIVHVEKQIERLKSLNGLFDSNRELDEAEIKLSRRKADRRLTNKVIAAAKVNLSSAV